MSDQRGQKWEPPPSGYTSSDQRKIDRYWKREKTALGRTVNDAMDGVRTLARRVRYALPDKTPGEREMLKVAIREDLEEKQWTRAHYRETGRMETRDEIAAEAHYSGQHARIQYEARQQGANLMDSEVREQLLEKFAVNMPISWEVVGGRQILPVLDGNSKDGGGERERAEAHLMGDTTTDRNKTDAITKQEVQASRQSVRDGLDDRPVSEAVRHLQNAAEYRAEIVAGGYREPGPDPFKERDGSTWVKHDNAERKELTELARAEVSKARELRESGQTLPLVGAKENGTMDSEASPAKQHVREREQERWNRVEQIGQQAIAADRARVTEKPTATTEADLATKAERQRPQTA